MGLLAYIKTVWQNGLAPAINATNLNKIEQGIYDVTKEVIAHTAEYASDGVHGLDATIAKFKTGTGTFTDDDTAQTFADAFCTANSLVVVSITSATNPQGTWSVEAADGSFTITSTAAESADITFDYYIVRVV
ncbi:MAG: hypothetical protein ACOZCL_08430 [Bacillota bacterium]